MFHKPWKHKEGTVLVLAILLAGLLLQLLLGPIDWKLFAWPVNILVVAALCASLAVMALLRDKVHLFSFMGSLGAAVPALLTAALATVCYGITNLRATLAFWPFVLLYLWIDLIVGLVGIKEAVKLFATAGTLRTRAVRLAALLSHLGLFLVLTCGTLGSADRHELSMVAERGTPIAVAFDENGVTRELPFKLVLNSFTLEEYPPRLALISNESGKELPDELSAHDIKIEKLLLNCAPSDSLGYVEYEKSGATNAALVSVDGSDAQWVSNGSYKFAPRSLEIDAEYTLVMPTCEPRRFVSNVSISSDSGREIENAEIAVNKPLRMEGWRIFQKNYDRVMGRWSYMSVLEIVRDPWLPAVFVGIFLLMAGAVLMFLTAGNGRKG